MSDIIAERMRSNLKKEYGIKVFHIGKPLLAIRIPKTEINEFDNDDSDYIKELLVDLKDQIHLDEVIHAYIIADKSYVVLDPYDIFCEVFDDVPIPKRKRPDAIQVIEPQPVTKMDHRTPIYRTPTYVAPVPRTPELIAPVYQARGDKKLEVVEEPEIEDTEIGAKSDEKIVRNILSDFAKTRKKKLVIGQMKSGRRAEVLTKGKRGRYVRSRLPDGEVTDIAVAPTIRAAALHAENGKIRVKKSDYREKVRRRRIATLINIVMDTSGSMDEMDKVDITRSVIVALLKDAYQRRDKVSLVTYSGRKGELVLPFTSSVERAKRYLETIPFGGTTPLASGILMGLHSLHNEIKKDPSTIPIMVLVTDGKSNVPLEVGGNIRRELSMVLHYVISEGIHVLIVDMSSHGSKLASEIAEEVNGRYYQPERLNKETLYKAISDQRDDASYFTNV
ncbi:MAG: VWA domain-containing protein [ANME-2 cluster archaeon]|nr:VWA domain-containing protein [ANME-2 cluster archaeon]MBC2700175.1 VWA domain-containing protein [ANME-2 cluster archaeon]MBC2706709.1 VWA domain-containing protein [ANME-2 cluster archaeon]MBC2745617.1 VWA domain-containing protein [ANME-2 cluster archaeon]MBC2763004.1 VWA domain-containing protein [ANME-2 cluster archaeon]